MRWRDEDEGAEGAPTLCDDLDDLCRLNERAIMALRPELLDALDFMMEDLLGVPDVKGYAMSEVVDVVVPTYGYESVRSALRCSLPSLYLGLRLTLGSLLVGLVADLAVRGPSAEARLRRALEEGVSLRDLARGEAYESLRRRVNEALGWLRGELGAEPVEFIYRAYVTLSRPIQVAPGRGKGALGEAMDGAVGLPLTLGSCFDYEGGEEGAIKGLLRRMHIAVDLARLSIDMVLYAWGYLTKAVDDETLESLRESIEEALDDLRDARGSEDEGAEAA
ncbi:MAG: hypothetical protein RXO24_12690 [Acidilobus sp.]